MRLNRHTARPTPFYTLLARIRLLDAFSMSTREPVNKQHQMQRVTASTSTNAAKMDTTKLYRTKTLEWQVERSCEVSIATKTGDPTAESLSTQTQAHRRELEIVGPGEVVTIWSHMW